MKKILLICFMFFISIFLCGCKNKDEDTLVINFNSNNIKEELYVSLIKVSDSNIIHEYGPFIIKNNQYKFILNDQLNNFFFMHGETLELVVRTKDDYLFLNTLNSPTFVEVEKIKTAEYKFVEEEINIDLFYKNVDSYFYDNSDCVIKLLFDDKNIEDINTKYEVGVNIKKNDLEYFHGGITSKNKYFEIGYKNNDHLIDENGYVSVKDLTTNEYIEYENYPYEVTFDNLGKCMEKVIKIKIK